MFVEGYIQ